MGGYHGGTISALEAVSLSPALRDARFFSCCSAWIRPMTRQVSLHPANAGSSIRAWPSALATIAPGRVRWRQLLRPPVSLREP